MLDLIFLILTGIFVGIAISAPIAFHVLERQLKLTDVAWQSLLNQNHDEWTKFYEHEAKTWQEYMETISEATHNNSFDAWNTKKPKPPSN